jgi:2-succinyl-5-enolpyruvyl-6-hydroxy-3-cyclohexene-1-carboxylate synthase
MAEANLDWATALVRGLAESGVRHAVLSPGSRSTPLALACDRCAAIILRVVPDERSAAYFALGIAKASGRPAAVICTSGTAAANWYPAVIEASMDDVAMVLLTADRPAHLRNTGANQTIDQRDLYGIYPRTFIDLEAPGADESDSAPARQAAIDAVSIACGAKPGPVHVNVAFDEPLFSPAAPDEIDWAAKSPVATQKQPTEPEQETMSDLAELIADRPGILVCGRDDYPQGFASELSALAATLDCPVIADPLSGFRWGSHDRSRLLTAADLLLRNAEFVSRNRPQWALQFGAAPTSAFTLKLLAHPDTKLCLVSERQRWADPSGTAVQRITADPLAIVRALRARQRERVPGEWCRSWLAMERQAATICNAPGPAPAEAQLVAATENALPDGAALFIGNSMVIRAFDAFGRGRDEDLRVFGNRGASGIDGNVSTILGIAAVFDTDVVGVVGDLTLYHDMNGLLAAKGLNATIVVVNNGGGAIFDLLDQRKLPNFEKLWLTPTGLDIGRIADLYGLRHTCITSGEDLQVAIARRSGEPGVALIEYQVDRCDSRRRWSELWKQAATLQPVRDTEGRVT